MSAQLQEQQQSTDDQPYDRIRARAADVPSPAAARPRYPSTQRCVIEQVIEDATGRPVSAGALKFLHAALAQHRASGRCVFTDAQANDEDALEKSRATESSPERSRASSPVA